ncbi:hypothetical protein OHA72_31820 [Dactylosporangium sp. NBC_01737]|uniref:hypothetical protein n=1 Tax=Dactylosporangium sp. NBC_01737 TaxID=2975959 RepID=UPI002E123BE8|nr:hypothetical protein OHA72_31820 [Dactylosporangium sp. NBC_01737]
MRVAPDAGRAVVKARAADRSRGTARTNDKVRGGGSTSGSASGTTSGDSATGALGGWMGLPDGAAGAPAAAAATDRTGGQQRTGTLALLGFGLVAAALTALGVTRVRRHPLTG